MGSVEPASYDEYVQENLLKTIFDGGVIIYVTDKDLAIKATMAGRPWSTSEMVEAYSNYALPNQIPSGSYCEIFGLGSETMSLTVVVSMLRMILERITADYCFVCELNISRIYKSAVFNNRRWSWTRIPIGNDNTLMIIPTQRLIMLPKKTDEKE